MKIVITGGAGFIGSALALELQDKHEVLIVDKMRSSTTFENENLESFGHFKNILDFEGELYVGDI
ncbi:ADP-L-glycero-D-manno-heptose-6-epimerase, partial [Vibrio parahaemolyticus]